MGKSSEEKNAFILSFDHKEVFDTLPPEKAGLLIQAVFAYENGEDVNLPDDLKIAFIPIRQWLDRMRARYEKTSEERAKAGARGGRPKKQKDSDESKKSNCFSEKAKKPDPDPDLDPDLEEADASVGAPEACPVVSLILNDGSEYPVSQEYADKMAELYPAVDMTVQFRKMSAWCINNPKKRKTRQGITRFINSWLSGEQDKGRASPPNNSPQKNPFITALQEMEGDP